MFKTRITELFGIEYPILQGALGGGLGGPELVAAVSNAGGLGILASLTYETTDELREEIRKTKSLTDKPFAVNVALLPTMREIRLKDYFTTAIEEGVDIIETAAGKVEPFMKLLKDANVKVIHKVGAARHAKTAERIGVDAVVLVGFEAAGHPLPEDVALSVLIPATVDAVNIPVIQAGGVGDARGFVSALAMGAEGVTMGTRFVATQECTGHLNLKEWLLELNERSTMTIQRTIGSNTRVVRTPHAEKIRELEDKGAPLEEILELVRGTRVSRSYETGDVKDAPITAGQVLGLIHDIPSVKDLIEGIISDAKDIVQRLHSIV